MIVVSDGIKQRYKFPFVAVRQRSMKQDFTQGGDRRNGDGPSSLDTAENIELDFNLENILNLNIMCSDSRLL